MKIVISDTTMQALKRRTVRDGFALTTAGEQQLADGRWRVRIDAEVHRALNAVRLKRETIEDAILRVLRKPS